MIGAVQGDGVDPEGDGFDDERLSGVRDLRPARLSILLPCRDEAARLAELVPRFVAAMDALPFASELVLVDDGSTDGSWALLEAIARREFRLVLRRHPRPLGVAASWRTAVEAARAPLVCVTDGDRRHRPEDIARLVAARESAGVEVSHIALRYEAPERGGRYWASRGFSALVNGAFGMSLPEHPSAFLVCRREVFAEALSFRGRYHAWQDLVLVGLHARGHRSVSIEAAASPPGAEPSPAREHPVRRGVLSLLDVATALREYRRG